MEVPKSISLEEFADLLCSEFGAQEASRMLEGDLLPIRYLRERLGLVFSRDSNGELSITRYR
jgi:hypothetical protein